MNTASMRLAIMAMLLVPAATPAVASGTTVKIGTGWVGGDEFSDGYPYADVAIVAAAGERNRLRIVVDRRRLDVQDDGAGVLAPAPCRRLSWRHVRCALPSEAANGVALTVRAGDQADRVEVTAAMARLFLYGGPGDDELSAPGDLVGMVADGGSGNDRVAGGAGVDELFGGAGNDRIAGGAGTDTLYGDGDSEGRRSASGSDHIDGGPDRDRVSYADHRGPVRIDLGAGRATGASERDTLVGIEDAQGGSGADRIAGDSRDNELEGMDGRDRVEGRGGDDRLLGGGNYWLTTPFGEGTIGFVARSSPRDRLFGGAGADRLAGGLVSDGGRGEDICAGMGTPQQPQRLPGCEWWTPAETAAAEARIATSLRATANGVEVTAIGAFELTLAPPGSLTPLATGSVNVRGRRPRAVILPFTPAATPTLPATVLVTRQGSGSALLSLR
jgi:Ca2+-binding RTX toxin-like protein